MVKRLQICSFIVKICKSVCFLKAKENTQSMQLSRKGKGYANFDVFLMFLLQYDDICLLRHHCDVVTVVFRSFFF